MAECHAIIDGKLHRLEDAPQRWWERLLGRKRTLWVPVEPEFRG